MKQSLFFNKTRKNISQDIKAISHQYLVKGDFIEKTISGVYRFLPLGFKVFKNIEKIIREEMEGIHAQEVFLPTLQNKELWEETGRWEEYGSELFRLNDIHEKELALGPTHEEEITDMVRRRVSSYKELPFALFQIQNKFRNELRSTGGLLRTREFIMKDLYSFHAENEDLINYYNKVKEAYSRIFKRCGLNAIPVNADSGTIGGDYSHEFMVESEVGEDTILLCAKCNYGANIEKIGNTKKCPECGGELKSKKAIEIGHIFRLGTKYSKVMKATYTNEKEEEKLILMGCYGIGLSRVMASIVESNNDKNGIVWPEEVSPFQVHLIGLLSSERVEKEAEKIYQDLKKEGISVLYDNRKDKSAGEKFMDSDLIGIANRVVVSEKNLQEKGIGFKKRDENKEKIISFNELIEILKK